MQELRQIRGLLSGLSHDELRQLNGDVVAHLNHSHRIKQAEAMNTLQVGTIADFTSVNLRKTIRIRVTKFNQKTVSGQQINIPDGTDMMATWRVAPSMLRIVSL